MKSPGEPVTAASIQLVGQMPNSIPEKDPIFDGSVTESAVSLLRVTCQAVEAALPEEANLLVDQVLLTLVDRAAP